MLEVGDDPPCDCDRERDLNWHESSGDKEARRQADAHGAPVGTNGLHGDGDAMPPPPLATHSFSAPRAPDLALEQRGHPISCAL
jgi:hypothetical protein